jgi:hypothetical protein
MRLMPRVRLPLGYTYVYLTYGNLLLPRKNNR